MSRYEVIFIKTTAEEKAIIKKEAEKERRSVNSFILWALAERRKENEKS